MDFHGELTREGVRGGREQFKWDTLKGQRNRERQNYLGVTAKLGVSAGFGKYNTNDWWRSEDKNTESSSSLNDEKQSIKSKEDQLLMEAMGFKPKRLMLVKDQLDSNAIEGFLKKEEGPKLREESRSNNCGPKSRSMPLVDSTEEARMVSGLGYRRYLKPTDWNVAVCDLDEEEILAPKGEIIAVQRPVHKRELLPVRPQIKEEPKIEPRGTHPPDSSHGVRNSDRRRSRSRDNHPRHRYP